MLTLLHNRKLKLMLQGNQERDSKNGSDKARKLMKYWEGEGGIQKWNNLGILICVQDHRKDRTAKGCTQQCVCVCLPYGFAVQKVSW